MRSKLAPVQSSRLKKLACPSCHTVNPLFLYANSRCSSCTDTIDTVTPTDHHEDGTPRFLGVSLESGFGFDLADVPVTRYWAKRLQRRQSFWRWAWHPWNDQNNTRRRKAGQQARRRLVRQHRAEKREARRERIENEAEILAFIHDEMRTRTRQHRRPSKGVKENEMDTPKYENFMTSFRSEPGKAGDKVHLSLDARERLNGHFVAEMLVCSDIVQHTAFLVLAENIEVTIDGKPVRTEAREAKLGGGVRITLSEKDEPFVGVTAHERIDVTILLTQDADFVEATIFGKLRVRK